MSFLLFLFLFVIPVFILVIPAKAGIHWIDSRFRGNNKSVAVHPKSYYTRPNFGGVDDNMSGLMRLLQAQVFRIVFYQLIIIMGFTLIIFCIKGIQNGLSALAAAMTYWFPTLLYVWRLSIHAGARALTKFMAAFFMGEVFKLSLCGLLFLTLIKYLDMNLMYAVVGLFVSIIAFWIASFISLYSDKRP